MRLRSVSVSTTGEKIRLSAEAESDRQPKPFELYFEYPREFKEFVAPSADPFAVAMLLPAMLHGEPLQIAPPLSPRLLFHLPRIRDIFHAWHPTMTRSPIEARPDGTDAAPTARRAATFFSGGVDSFFTLLRYGPGGESLPTPLTHIIFMRGLEKPLDFLRGVEAAETLVETIAVNAGVHCILGESNLRTYFDADWLNLYAGSGLAAAALSLSGGFSHVCIPSTYSYRYPVVSGSTPLVDPQYSNERVQVVHDGAELSRAEKLRQIIEWNRELVLNHLRVCVMNFGGAHNCCECRKCVRTLMPLKALGVLDAATTFPNRSTKKWQEVATEDSLPFVEENLEFAQAHNGDPVLTALLERIVLRRRRKEALRALISNSTYRGILPIIVSARRHFKGFKDRVRGRL